MFVAIYDCCCRKGKTVQEAWDELVGNGEAGEDDFDCIEFYELSKQLEVERAVKIVEKSVVTTPKPIRK